MSYSRRSRYSPSPSPYERYQRSVSRSISRSRSRSRSVSVENPGNNLYVTGLSAWVTRRDLKKHFSAEGKVEDIYLVVDPTTQESRGFGFVTMSLREEANRCIKYLDGSVLGSRVITVEKSRRRRGRAPTPGRYLGLKADRGRRRSPRYSSPYYRRRRSRSYSPYHYNNSRERYNYSPDHHCCSRISRYRSISRSVSPFVRRRDHSLSRSPNWLSWSMETRSPSPVYRRSLSRRTSFSPRRRRDYYVSRSRSVRSRSASPSY